MFERSMDQWIAPPSLRSKLNWISPASPVWNQQFQMFQVSQIPLGSDLSSGFWQVLAMWRQFASPLNPLLMTVETTVCLKEQTIGRCRFWFKELTDEQCLRQVSTLGPSEWRHLAYRVQRLGGAGPWAHKQVGRAAGPPLHSGERRVGCCTGGAGAAVARCWGLPRTGGCGTCTPAHPGTENWKCRRQAGHSRPGSQVGGQAQGPLRWLRRVHLRDGDRAGRGGWGEASKGGQSPELPRRSHKRSPSKGRAVKEEERSEDRRRDRAEEERRSEKKRDREEKDREERVPEEKKKKDKKKKEKKKGKKVRRGSRKHKRLARLAENSYKEVHRTLPDNILNERPRLESGRDKRSH